MKIIFKNFHESFSGKPDFKIRSFSLYQELDKILNDKYQKIENFNILNDWFEKDITLRIKLYKYINYIEHKLAAELINFWYENQEEIKNKIFDKKEQIKQPNSKTENNDIKKFNEILKDINLKKDYKIVDKLSFGQKLMLAKIFIFHNKINVLSKKLETSLDTKNIKK